MNTGKYLEISANIWRYLEISGDISQHCHFEKARFVSEIRKSQQEITVPKRKNDA